MTTFTNHQDFQSVFMNQANYYGEKNRHGKGNFSTVFMSLSQKKTCMVKAILVPYS